MQSAGLNVTQNVNFLDEATKALPEWMFHRKSKHHYARVLRAVARRQKRNTTSAQRKAAKRKANINRLRDVMNDLGR